MIVTPLWFRHRGVVVSPRTEPSAKRYYGIVALGHLVGYRPTCHTCDDYGYVYTCRTDDYPYYTRPCPTCDGLVCLPHVILEPRPKDLTRTEIATWYVAVMIVALRTLFYGKPIQALRMQAYRALRSGPDWFWAMELGAYNEAHRQRLLR